MTERKPASMLIALMKRMVGEKNTVPLHLFLVDLTGDHLAALVMAQLLYWADRTSSQTGEIVKSDDEWYKELRLTGHMLRRIRARLVTLNFISAKRRRSQYHKDKPVYHYLVNEVMVTAAVEALLHVEKPSNLRKPQVAQTGGTQPAETGALFNTETPSEPLKIAADAAHAPSNGVKAGSYQERTGKTEAECEAEAKIEAEKQLAVDIRRMEMNEQLDLLEKAVKHYFGYGGTLATKYARTFYGVFKGGKKQKADDSKFTEQTALLKDAPVTANEFTEWAAAYCKERGYEPNHPDMVREIEKVVSYILARRDLVAAKVISVTDAPAPDPVITDADRAANLELMRANNPFGAPKGKAS